MAVTVVTHACRAAILVAALWVALYQQTSAQLLQRAWDRMRASPWVRHDTFEPSVVVITFGVSILLFYILDKPLGRFTQTWRTSINPDHDMSAWDWEGGKRVFQETLLYVTPIALFDLAYPRRQLPLQAPSVPRLCGEVLLSLLLYDALFTLGHLACHKLPWLYRYCHMKHHRMRTVRACETICLTPWEEALDVLCSIAALNLCRAHPMSRCIYNIVIVYLLTELHSGYELPWMLQDVVPWGLWAGSRAHAQHHKRGNVAYQKFFTYMDRAMGTAVLAWGRSSS